ncbi:hypothetical protein QBC47DRAFT_333075 [Echria macrotheca]|uniref:DNA repair protein Rad26 n=1 Tax=Echria macrotheca TaxID=438768 RepID=A0AAJ0B149_9PEZI|nr:hypothetical protein QBC47DRAFT_333075 [Echria macrotheca]
MDDDFSDGGFDDLNDTVWEELEHNAIQATQAQRFPQSQAPPTGRPPVEYIVIDDDDLDDTVVVDEGARQPPIADAERDNPQLPQQQRWNQQFRQPPPPQSQFQPPRQPNYPPRPQHPAPQRPAAPLQSQRFPQASRPVVPSQRFPPGPIAQRPAPQASQFSRPPPPPINRPFTAQSTQAPPGAAPAKQNEIISALQARLSALESELTTAKGEASILRSKFEKAQATHDAEVNRLKKQSAEQIANQERAIEAARAAERKAATELQFAHQDLREELGRAKSRKKDGAVTPKKNRAWGIADGFDGVEMTGSPSKTQAQKKKDSASALVPLLERTPTKGKRKRPVVDSPTFALETHSGEEVKHATAPANAFRRLGSEGLPFDFLKLALDHSVFHGQPLTFDLFSRFAFPSQPEQTFSSIIFQKLPQMGDSNEPMSLLIDFAQFVVDLWQQCLSERYHAPIYYLAALLVYVLQLNAVVVAPQITPSLVPVCTTTCRLVALPRFNSQDGDISQYSDAAVRQLDHDGDAAQALSVLYLAALGCLSPDTETDDATDSGSTPQIDFWRTVDMEFVILMLSPKQTELDWLGTLSLLSTSILPHSIGPIPKTEPAFPDDTINDADSPEVVGTAVIERLSTCLVEQPRWATPGTAKQLLALLAVLKTLVLFGTSRFGLLRIGSSDVTIQRIVTVLSWAVDQLYDTDSPFVPRNPELSSVDRGKPQAELAGGVGKVEDDDGLDKMDVDFVEPVNSDPPGLLDILVDEFDPYSPELLSGIIAQSVLLLHTLVTSPETCEVVNMKAQLATCNGCSQRYLLTLSRLNFSEEDLVLEAGIDANTGDLANELLELAVTPDEGEEMGSLFGII